MLIILVNTEHTSGLFSLPAQASFPLISQNHHQHSCLLHLTVSRFRVTKKRADMASGHCPVKHWESLLSPELYALDTTHMAVCDPPALPTSRAPHLFWNVLGGSGPPPPPLYRTIWLSLFGITIFPIMLRDLTFSHPKRPQMVIFVEKEACSVAHIPWLPGQSL